MNIWKISEKYILIQTYKYFIFMTLNNIVNNIIKLKKELTWDSFVTQILKNI